MQILVIGTGYVGLVAAAGFAEAGHRVLGIDNDAGKIAKIREGVSPIYEPGLDELLARHQASGSLAFSLDLSDGIAAADAAFICVGTPQSEDGSADLQYVLSVAGAIGSAMALRPLDAKPLVVVDKSTVPVGTAARVHAAIAAKTDRPFEVVSNPEFLREGCAIDDFIRPDRVVVGCRTDHAAAVMKGLYGKFLEASGGQWLRMDPPSAELTKYAANAMLALRISFINEIAGLCEKVGADVDFVKQGIGSDHRIGKFFLNPGPGFGGSCFPKDLQALLKVGRENAHPLRALEATVEANRHQKQVLALKVRAHYDCASGAPAPLAGRRFALWGLAFKAHTDDIREAMSMELIDSLASLGARVVVHDFEAMENVKAKLGDRVEYAADFMEACRGADALLIATEWPQYAAADLEKVGGLLKAKVMFDGRNLFRPEAMKAAGWTYHSIGRVTVSQA
ncbi:UDP-glucose dehydrogenase family protein [Mesoterricola silvestris]|uniref:UDP-glucose 6-dehydrogenase n=1 Tax=Mesoterricola silvestris TaxID=2927979 RepID=A0AA48H666_9BACT|nr:UDP-glucose/GDP-mannose dehydrogenase family protein [Mesoterricola silvestris]BDU72573.1 UDP-glucose 6-dehydrogenase [Mesoterricola silvestris]